jgi:FkbM family methyltransferase
MLKETIYAYNKGDIDKHAFIKKMHKNHCTLYEYADHLPKTDISKIEITDDKVIMTDRKYGIRMQCDYKDHRAIPIEIINFGEYEKEDCEMLIKLSTNCRYMYDIGANFGWYSMFMATYFPDMHILAFEPVEDTYKHLQTNLRLNHFPNVVPYNCGFSDKQELGTINCYPEGSGNASLMNLSKRKDINTTIASFITLNNLSEYAVDIIKCDVEGAEMLVLKGGDVLIPEKKPIILIELCEKWLHQFDTSRKEIIDYLKNWGYSCFVAVGKKLLPYIEGDKGVNFFFLHNQKHKNLILKYGVTTN